MRIIVVGTTGSGKTTLARKISQKLNIPHIELDALHWQPNWTPESKELLREKVKNAIAEEKWVMDGNYSSLRNMTWVRAQQIVWLDYPFFLNFSRLFRRTLKRIFTKEKLWAGNRETIYDTFFTKDSILHWFFITYGKRKKEYPELFKKPDFSHLKVFRHKHPNQTEKWFNQL